MKRCLLLAAMMLSCALVMAPARAARAQTPPPVPLGVRLVLTVDGRVQLVWDDRGRAPDRYGIHVLIVPVDAVAAGDEYDLGILSGAATTFLLPVELPGILSGNCYQVLFSVTAQYDDGRTPERSGLAGQSACGGADGHVEYVGAPLHDPLPAPPPPSDVRLVRDGAGWQLEWRDNSSDEAQFQPGVIIADETGGAVASVTLPPQRRDTTVLELPQRITSEAPASGCYTAKLYVFAVGLDGGTTLPGNGEAPVCIEGTLIRFPDAGDGGSLTRQPRASLPAAGTLALGAIVLFAGVRTRRRKA